jgi:hypothetical protein
MPMTIKAASLIATIVDAAEDRLESKKTMASDHDERITKQVDT